MILVVGLGNPGTPYHGTRHNIGREIIIEWQKGHDFADFIFEKKRGALISKNKNVILLLPETMMNKSGNAVGPIARFYKIKPKGVFIIHDDADISLGRAKLSFGKHSAGHKGVESVMRALKTRDFWRFRIGIAGKRNIPAEKLVLRIWSSDELRAVKKITKQTIAALQRAVGDGPERAMNEYNQ